jgi:hypothetical protein
LKLSVIIVDFMMLYVLPKRAIYAKEKYVRTEDFSQLEERKKEELEREERKKSRKIRRQQRKLRQLEQEGKND